MFILGNSLRRSLSQFRLTPNSLVNSSRWSSTVDTGKPVDGEKKPENEKEADGETVNEKKKSEHSNPEYQRALQQQDELFEEFTKSTADMALVEKQNKFLGN